MAKKFSVPLILCAILFLNRCDAHAQQAGSPATQNIAAPNAIFFELGGNCLLGSINYERQLNDSYSLRVGIAPLVIVDPDSHLYIATFLGNTLFGDSLHNSPFWGSALHNVQLGIGMTVITGTRKIDFSSTSSAVSSSANRSGDDYPNVHTYLVPTADLGFRYQPQNGGVMLQMSFTPLLFINNSGASYTFLFYAGISLGYVF
jgi:hypothetical protein